jgi:hypothetical protein
MDELKPCVIEICADAFDICGNIIGRRACVYEMWELFVFLALRPIVVVFAQPSSGL